jgi:hypothetical protein
MKTAETVVTVSKWASILTHVKANRVEYACLLIMLHLVGALDKAHSQFSGVCI